MKQGIRIKLILLAILFARSGTMSAAITINSVQSTQSNCANDGTITVNAQSNTTMLYAIISGPDIRPAQNGNQFGGLPIGSYQVMVTNFSNDTAFTNATVGGTYVFPDFAPTFTNPICPNSNTGAIVGHVIPGTGTAPYSWQITNINTGVTSTQSSDTFDNLYGGDYSIRLFDSCQSFATRYVTLTNPLSTFTLADPVFNTMISCDTAIMQIQLWTKHGYWVDPYIISVHMGAVVKTDTIYRPLTPNDIFTVFYDTIAGVNYGNSGYVSVTNGCGETATVGHYIDNWGLNHSFYATTDSCNPRLSLSVGFTNNYFSRTAFAPPITFVMKDVTAGFTVIDSTVFLTPTSYYYPTNFTLQYNHQYYMTVYDECGNMAQRYVTTPVLDTVRVQVIKDQDGCLDSTGTINIHCYNYSNKTTQLTILSGPPTSHSSKKYFEHNDTLIYPMTGFNINHCSGYSANEACFGVGGLSPGTYRFRVQDSCGHSYTDTFVIRNTNIVTYDFTAAPVRGCPGQNKLKFVVSRSLNYTMQDFIRLYPVNSTVAIDSMVSDSAAFANLNAGTYRLEHEINRYHNFDMVMPNMPCNIIRDTIVVPPYQLPKIDYATQIKCNGTVNVGLQPDSNTGVPPYVYEILSGPQTFPAQSANFFTLTLPGTYSARINDTCGFARTFTFSVDTLSFKQIVEVGSSCPGNSAMLVAQHSPYATYVWQRPNGTKYTGDSLHLSPVLPTDYGLYHISKIVNVNSCRDTFYTTYNLVSNSRTNLYDTVCAGGSAVFAGNTYTQTGIYYDTLTTATCDSIVAFNLTVKAPASDSVAQTICTGQSITIGAHTYSATGIYRDTFATAGCDSIHILNLTVGGAKTDSVAQSICTGQSVTVGLHTYTTTGIYRDTFATAGCDSIHILNLTVGGAKTDSVAQSICTGQSVTVGLHTYTTTGIYRDTFATAGCDSIHILNLTVGGAKTDSVAQSICTGQSVTVGLHTYNTTGIYRDTFATAGCDSIHILNLTVGGAKTDSVAQSICTGQSVTVGLHTYTTTGIYRDTFATAGCDSIHILNLTVGGAKTDSVAQSICTGQSVTVGLHTYTTTGIYRDTFATAGCDSIHILNLTVGGAKTDSVAQSICTGQSVTVGLHTYTTTGIYRDTFATAGCDSIHILNLTVGGYKTNNVNSSICAGQSITIGLNTYTAAGIYRDTFVTAGCDSIHILNLTVTQAARDTLSFSVCQGQQIIIEGRPYTSAGIYSDTFGTSGCDSIRFIQLSYFADAQVTISAAAEQVSPGAEVQLNATPGPSYTYYWTSTATLNNNSIANPLATIAQTAWIYVQATDSNSCVARDSILITADACEATVYVPNVFSPNEDGSNDRFRVYGNCIKLNSLQVFDRWGQLVWETTDIDQSWDGYYRGTLQPPAVYVYLLNYGALHATSGTGKQLKGSLTLIR